MRFTALPSSRELMLDSRAKQSERAVFADVLREAADIIEGRELRPTERISFTHVEFRIEDDET